MQASRLRPGVALLLGFLSAGLAHATLGGDITSINADALTLKSMASASPANGYTRYDIPNGTGVIHEYVGPAGVVFALGFSNGGLPPLATLLGGYRDAFVAAQSNEGPVNRRNLVINTPSLRAVMHGRPNAIQGHIWVPSLVPAGLDAGGLQ